jgi:GntR family transcriptional regulator
MAGLGNQTSLRGTSPHTVTDDPKSSRQRSARRVYDLLRAAIRSGAIEQRDLFVEHSIMRNFGTSRTSVREALQMLADDGLVIRAPRIGTVLTGSIEEIPVHEAPGETPAVLEDSPGYSVELLDQRTITSPYLARRIESDDPRLAVQEYRLVQHGRPIEVLTIYATAAPVQQVPYFDKLVDRWGSFERRFGVPVGVVTSTIEAVACEPRTAQLLQLADKAPVLRRETLVRDADGAARELSYAHYRADRVALTVRNNYADMR